MFSLLQVQPELVERVVEPLWHQEVVKRRKINKNWLNGYIIYASVVLQMYPNKAVALFKYLDIINWVFRDYTGLAWTSDDEHFMLRASLDPVLDWRVPQWELWSLQANVWKIDPIVVISLHATGLILPGHWLVHRGFKHTHTPAPVYKYNALGRCSRNHCVFTHACVQCEAKHPVSSCPKLGWAKQGSRGQQSGRRDRNLLGKAKGAQHQLNYISWLKVYSFIPDVWAAGYLFKGFSEGFRILASSLGQFNWADNLKSVKGLEDVVRQKINKEVLAGRVVGPFACLPLPNLQISPLEVPDL